MPKALLFLCLGLSVIQPVAAEAETAPEVSALTQEIRARLPQDWQLHVRWRDNVLLASVNPRSNQEAFDLWNDPQKRIERLRALCPAADDAIWQRLKPNQDIVLEPTVGGKTMASMRLSCRAEGGHPPA
jgi:hypothetical protein